ncbi:MAG TPA: ADOP family duplicated permease [Gemmatimonadaceae bacterium]|nr:ADOP family duplicated permease [Gemmatimonadaceae bacterium]
MPTVPPWRRYLRFWRPDVAADIDDELRFHFEARTAELRAQGLSPEEAQRQTAEEFGDEVAVRARLRDIGDRMERRRARFLWWDAAHADLRYALRGLKTNPLFTGAVVLTLAIGIGATTTMYGVMRRLLLQPPPGVSAPEQLSKLFLRWEAAGVSARTTDRSSYPLFQVLHDRATTLAAAAAYLDGREVRVGHGTEAEIVSATLVSGDFWRALGVHAALGRLMTAEEAHPVTGARVVVLGHAFWQQRYGGDRAVVGTTLELQGTPYRIIGVAPRGFRGVEHAETALWLPLFAYADALAGGREWYTFGGDGILAYVVRPRPGVTQAQVAADLSRLFQGFVEGRRRPGDEARPDVRTLVRLGPVTGALGSDMTRRPEATVSVWLVGVAAVLLVIACANVGGLLLLRAMRRRREIAVRLALGMSRRRLAVLLLVESGMLALLGGLASGIVVVWGGVWVRRALLTTMATESAGPDWHVLGLAVACTIGTALVTGLVPVLQTRGDATAGLKDGGQHGATRRSRLHRTLLVGQTALSVALLVGAGLFLRSLHEIGTLDLGLDTRNVLAVDVDFTGTGRSRRETMPFFERALERLRAVPGVEHASLAISAPLHGARGSSIRPRGASEPFRDGDEWVNYVADDFFAATGMTILEGRGITAADRSGPRVVVVNEALARAAWPGRSPIGDCVYTSAAKDVCAEVVGVVKDARTFGLREEEQWLWFYAPLPPDDVDTRVLLVRTTPGVTGMTATLRRALQELDPNLPYIEIQVLGDVLDPQIRPWRLGAALFTTFGVVAMLLAALGLYAAVAYAVAQRTREIGVRVAVGATTGNVVGLVLGDGVRIALAGIVAGLALALLGGPLIADLLFDVSPRDPLVLAGVGGGVLLAALLASLLPARRAARVDPVTALRVD